MFEKYHGLICLSLLAILCSRLATAQEDLSNAQGNTGYNKSLRPSQGIESGVKPGYELVRIKAVAPVYPRKAQNDKLEGWVDLLVTVNPKGDVAQAVVVDAEPRRVFERAAIRAAYKWRFAPPADDGIDDNQQAVVRVSFKVET